MKVSFSKKKMLKILWSVEEFTVLQRMPLVWNALCFYKSVAPSPRFSDHNEGGIRPVMGRYCCFLMKCLCKEQGGQLMPWVNNFAECVFEENVTAKKLKNAWVRKINKLTKHSSETGDPRKRACKNNQLRPFVFLSSSLSFRGKTEPSPL